MLSPLARQPCTSARRSSSVLRLAMPPGSDSLAGPSTWGPRSGYEQGKAILLACGVELGGPRGEITQVSQASRFTETFLEAAREVQRQGVTVTRCVQFAAAHGDVT